MDEILRMIFVDMGVSFAFCFIALMTMFVALAITRAVKNVTINEDRLKHERLMETERRVAVDTRLIDARIEARRERN